MVLTARRQPDSLPEVAAPSVLLLVSEPLRALAEWGAGLVLRRTVRRLAPAGDGHPVLVLPGLGASDRSTALLRRFLGDLGDLGYQALPWELGRNKGVRSGLEERMRTRLRQVHAQTGRKITLVGQSLGGVYARELAKLEPDSVRQVISLGSPFAGHPHATHATRLYEALSGDRVDDIPQERQARVCRKPPVPTTSLYSKADGESIHLRGGSHLGMAASPAALWLLADRLAQPEGRWQPFDPQGWQRLAYGVNDHVGGPAAGAAS